MRSVSEYWSSAARRAEPYVPGDQPGGKVIKLNTNENPYPPSPKVLSALREAVGPDLRLYPDPTAAKVRSTAAKLYGLSPGSVRGQRIRRSWPLLSSFPEQAYPFP